MAWFYNGRKYWYHNGKRYSRKIKKRFKPGKWVKVNYSLKKKNKYFKKNNKILIHWENENGYNKKYYVSYENGKYYYLDYNDRRIMCDDYCIKEEISEEQANYYLKGRGKFKNIDEDWNDEIETIF